MRRLLPTLRATVAARMSSDLDYFCEWCETWYVVRVLASDCRTRHLESNVIDPRDDCESSGGVAQPG